MKFVITINYNYKNKELYQKVIKIPLNSEIKVLKDKNMYIIALSNDNDIDTHLYELKEEEINSFEIRRIN